MAGSRPRSAKPALAYASLGSLFPEAPPLEKFYRYEDDVAHPKSGHCSSQPWSLPYWHYGFKSHCLGGRAAQFRCSAGALLTCEYYIPVIPEPGFNFMGISQPCRTYGYDDGDKLFDGARPRPRWHRRGSASPDKACMRGEESYSGRPSSGYMTNAMHRQSKDPGIPICSAVPGRPCWAQFGREGHPSSASARLGGSAWSGHIPQELANSRDRGPSAMETAILSGHNHAVLYVRRPR